MLLLEALAELAWLDLCGLISFRALYASVSDLPVASRPGANDDLTLIRVAVRDTCIFYFKPVLCLQRSAAVTRMLRRRGVRATLVIGYQPTPIYGHAWVEVADSVVWDSKPDLSTYSVLTRL
jgi:hypothetical protein